MERELMEQVAESRKILTRELETSQQVGNLFRYVLESRH